MKKISLALIVMAIATSCSCLLSQVPPQTQYVDENCQAQLLDYRANVVASDNCGDVTLTQVPVPGFLLTSASPVTEVTITGTDAFGNTTSIQFNVNLIDTVPPILEWNGGTMAMGQVKIGDLWDNLLTHTDEAIAHFIYDQSWTQGMPFADSTIIEEQLRWFTYSHKIDSTQLVLYTDYMNSRE